MTGTPDQNPTTGLFSPIRISSLTIKNRIIMPALILNFPFKGVDVGDEWIRFYRRRAEGGAGLIIVGACYVEPTGKMDRHQIGVDRDEWIPALAKIAQSIKAGSNESLSISASQVLDTGDYCG